MGAWRTIFFVAIAFYLSGTIFYGLYGSGEEQPWNAVGHSRLNTVSYDGTKDEATAFKSGVSETAYGEL